MTNAELIRVAGLALVILCTPAAVLLRPRADSDGDTGCGLLTLGVATIILAGTIIVFLVAEVGGCL